MWRLLRANDSFYLPGERNLQRRWMGEKQMSEPLWLDGDPIALGTDDDHEEDDDIFDRADDAYDRLMEK